VKCFRKFHERLSLLLYASASLLFPQNKPFLVAITIKFEHHHVRSVLKATVTKLDSSFHYI
jgi:hypothetical protein